MNSSPESTLQHGINASQTGDSERAIALFTQATQEDSSNGVPYLLLGAEWAQRGEMQQAEAAFANAILLSPELVVARFQLGLLQMTSDRAAVAFLTWQPLLELAADEPIRYYVAGYMAMAQDRFDEAIATFRQGLAQPQTNPALARDVEMTIAAITQQTQGTSPEPQSHDDAETESLESHILLSNYTSNGTMH